MSQPQGEGATEGHGGKIGIFSPTQAWFLLYLYLK